MPIAKPQFHQSYLGVDPGMSGGLTLLGQQVSVQSMPDTERDIWHWIRDCNSVSDGVSINPVVAVIEKVHSMPQQGVSSTFKFGQSYGFLRACLIAAEIPFEEVTPQCWQKGLSIPKRDKAETQTQWKNRLKARAQQEFPSVKVTLATADALLIALYCQRKHEGTL